MECINQQKNTKACTCAYEGYARHGLCCECLHHHRKQNQLPACLFSKEAEATYNRSFAEFIEDSHGK